LKILAQLKSTKISLRFQGFSIDRNMRNHFMTLAHTTISIPPYNSTSERNYDQRMFFSLPCHMNAPNM